MWDWTHEIRWSSKHSCDYLVMWSQLDGWQTWTNVCGLNVIGVIPDVWYWSRDFSPLVFIKGPRIWLPFVNVGRICRNRALSRLTCVCFRIGIRRYQRRNPCAIQPGPNVAWFECPKRGHFANQVQFNQEKKFTNWVKTVLIGGEYSTALLCVPLP